MDVISLFNALPPALQAALLGLLLASYLASHLISLTGTPAPNTPWGRIYRAIELVAGVYGQAKAVGIPVATPQDVVSRLGAALAAGQTLTPEALAEILGKPAQQPQAGRSPGSAAVVGALMMAITIGSGLSACTSTGELTPEAQRAIQIGCNVDGVVQPVAVAVAANFEHTAGAAAIDQQLVHPAVVAACKAVNGTPAAVPAGK